MLIASAQWPPSHLSHRHSCPNNPIVQWSHQKSDKIVPKPRRRVSGQLSAAAFGCRLLAVVPENQTKLPGNVEDIKQPFTLVTPLHLNLPGRDRKGNYFPKEDDLTSKPEQELALWELLKRYHHCRAVSMEKTELPCWPPVPLLAIRPQRKRL